MSSDRPRRRPDTVRESAEVYPEPTGSWDGITRAAALKALLDKHEEPNAPSASAPTRRWGRILGLAVLALILVAPFARAQRLTPQEAADILRPNQFVGTVTYDGPTVVIAPYSGERYVPSDLDVYLSARFHRSLRRRDGPYSSAARAGRSAYSASLGRGRDDWRRRGLPRSDASERIWNLRPREYQWRDDRPRSR